jgi:hypothetical protein
MALSPLTTTEPGPRHLPADRFHPKVRLGALSLWLVIVGLLYIVGDVIWRVFIDPNATGAWLPLLLGALILSQPLARVSERQLMRVLPSGRSISLDSGTLTMREKSVSDQFDLNGGAVNYWRWYFKVINRRSGRVSNGDLVCALRLVQGEREANLYAFIPKKQAESFLARYTFYELKPLSETTKGKMTLGGHDAVYRAAEKARWELGAELDPLDFDATLAHLAAHLPNFKVNSSS